MSLNKNILKIGGRIKMFVKKLLKHILPLPAARSNEAQKRILEEISTLREELVALRNELMSSQKSNIFSETPLLVSKYISAALVNNKVFPRFKDYCSGKKLVLCGAGPSLSQYIPIPNAVHLAVNRAFLFDKVKFDFWISQDFNGIKMVQQELIEYTGNNCVKFFGSQSRENDQLVLNFPENLIKESGGIVYATDGFYSSLISPEKRRFVCDIETRPLSAMTSSGLSAMQFALYMNPAKLYIVGCDESGNHFSSKNQTQEQIEAESENMKNYWESKSLQNKFLWNELKKFAEVHYPNTKIISVNPVGLKGIFKDWYQSEGEEPK